MRKSLKLIVMAAVLSTGVAAMSGCGGSFDGVTVNFWHTFGKTVADGIQAQADHFAKLVKDNEGVSVRIKMTYKGGYEDLLGEVNKAFAVGGNPTMAVAYPDHVADYFAAETKPGEYVVDLTEYANSTQYGWNTEEWLGDKAGQDDFVPAFINEGTSYARKGLYSIPFLKSTEVMLYNLDLVKKAMTYYDPDIQTDDDIRAFMEDLTWQEFMDFCEIIAEKKAEISEKLEYPAFYDSDGNLFITQMFQRDIPYSGISSEGNGYIGFNGIAANATEEQKQAYQDVTSMLKEYKGWYDQKFFTTKGVVGQYSSYYFTPQKTMFAIGSSGGSGYSFPSTNEFTIGVCKVPYANGKPVYVSQGPTLTVLNNSKLIKSGENDETVKYAWKFIKYLTNPEVNAALCTNNSEGYVPVRESAYDTDEFTSFMASSTPYVKVAQVVVNEIDGSYFNSAVFKGSATLRKNCEGLFADVMKLKANPSDADIQKIIDTAINQTVSRM